jgi:hypothetical protein
LNDEFFLVIYLVLTTFTTFPGRSGLSIGQSDLSHCRIGQRAEQRRRQFISKKLLTRPATPSLKRNLFYDTHDKPQPCLLRTQSFVENLVLAYFDRFTLSYPLVHFRHPPI